MRINKQIAYQIAQKFGVTLNISFSVFVFEIKGRKKTLT